MNAMLSLQLCGERLRELAIYEGHVCSFMYTQSPNLFPHNHFANEASQVSFVFF